MGQGSRQKDSPGDLKGRRENGFFVRWEKNALQLSL